MVNLFGLNLSFLIESAKSVLDIIWIFLKAWWWVFPPFILFPWLIKFYLEYKHEAYANSLEKVLLEIKMPREVERPAKSMEQVFSNFWTLYDPPTWQENWLEGHILLSFSLEIVSTEGNIHFYLRIPKPLISMFRAALYAEYPDIELNEAVDYTKYIPQDIPNKDWDFYGWDFVLTRSSAYPIKTYKEFFEEKDETKEEKRMSALSVLLEGMAEMGKGEHMWVQIIVKPILDEVAWKDEAQKIINKIVNRPSKKEPRSIVGQAIDLLLKGMVPDGDGGGEESKEVLPPEMKMTPGEREIVQAIEHKMSKLAFETSIRFMYLGKRDAFFKPKVKIPLDYSAGISSGNLNGMKPFKETLPKRLPPAISRKRKVYVLKRQLFRRYKMRVSPLFPKGGGTFVVNTEELATLFHLPGQSMAPSLKVPRIESKKAGPPSDLPVE